MPGLVFDQQTSVDPALTPADARGASFTPAVGEATQQLGVQVSKVASDQARLNYAQEQADRVAALQKNVSDGYINITKWMEEQKGQTLQQNPNGAGYGDVVMQRLNDWGSQLVDQQTDPRVRRMAAEQARTLTEHFMTHAITWENETRRSWRTGQLDDSITGGASIIDADPTTYEPMLHDTLANIQAAAGDLHPQQARALQERATREFSQAAALSYARTHPQDTVNAILPSQPLPANSIPDKIASAAKQYDVDPHSALAIAQFESHMDPNAVPRDKSGKLLSSAGGLYQQIDSNWQDYGKGKDRFDPDANIDAGMRFMADNTRAFRDTFKRDPSLPELYSMHMLGMGGGMALAKAPADMSFDALVGQYDNNHAAVTANNGFTGMTVGQVRNKIAGWMQGAALQTAGYAKAADHDGTPEATASALGDLPWLTKLNPSERQAILTHAQSNLKRDDAGARAIVDQQANDAITMLQNGVMPKKLPTFDDFVRAGYPAQAAAIKANAVQQWQGYGAAVAKVQTASPDEQLQILANAKPTADTPNYASAVSAYNHLDNAIQQVNKERAFDPIAYDQKSGLKVTQPIDFSNPQFLQGPLSSRFAQAGQVAQTSGTPYQPFSKQEAYGLGQFLDKADAPTAIQYLSAIRGAADSPEHFTAAMAQIAPTHPILATAAQLAQANPAVAQKVLEGDRILNPGKGDPEREGKAKIPLPAPQVFAQAWDTARGAAYAGLPQTSQADLTAAIAYYTAIQAAGARSEKVLDTELWKKAVDAVAPASDYNGRKVLVPAGSDPAKFPDTVTQAWPKALARFGLDAKDYPAGAYSLASAGVDGVYVPVAGTTPLYAGGRPVVIDLNQTEHVPMAPVPPQQPDTTQPRNLKGRPLTLADLKMAKRFK